VEEPLAALLRTQFLSFVESRRRSSE